jgi:hypothetical protein
VSWNEPTVTTCYVDLLLLPIIYWSKGSTLISIYSPEHWVHTMDQSTCSTNVVFIILLYLDEWKNSLLNGQKMQYV